MKRDGTHGASCVGGGGPTTSLWGDPCPRPVPLPWPRARDRPREASYPGASGASGHSVGAAKAAAPCPGWAPRLGPRPPARPRGGRWRRGEQGSPQERSGKVLPLLRLPPQPDAEAKCRLDPGFERTQRTEPGTRGAAGPELCPRGTLAPTPGALWKLAGVLARACEGHWGHLSLPPHPPSLKSSFLTHSPGLCHLHCVTGRGKGGGRAVD